MSGSTSLRVTGWSIDPDTTSPVAIAITLDGAAAATVAAAVVASPDVTREQIRAWCIERLSAHKVPRIVKLIDAIPVDERGKVKRAALAALGNGEC